MLIRYPPHNKGQWKNLVLASDSSNQQTLVLKKKSVESVKTRFQQSVQMMLKLDIWNICLDQIHKIIHTWKLYIKAYIRKIV